MRLLIRLPVVSAGMGQRSSVVEQLTRNEQVNGSNPFAGSIFVPVTYWLDRSYSTKHRKVAPLDLARCKCFLVRFCGYLLPIYYHLEYVTASFRGSTTKVSGCLLPSLLGLTTTFSPGWPGILADQSQPYCQFSGVYYQLYYHLGQIRRSPGSSRGHPLDSEVSRWIRRSPGSFPVVPPVPEDAR
jgi:hypothetical protein